MLFFLSPFLQYSFSTHTTVDRNSQAARVKHERAQTVQGTECQIKLYSDRGYCWPCLDALCMDSVNEQISVLTFNCILFCFKVFFIIIAKTSKIRAAEECANAWLKSLFEYIKRLWHWTTLPYLQIIYFKMEFFFSNCFDFSEPQDRKSVV